MTKWATLVINAQVGIIGQILSYNIALSPHQ